MSTTFRVGLFFTAFLCFFSCRSPNLAQQRHKAATAQSPAEPLTNVPTVVAQVKDVLPGICSACLAQPCVAHVEVIAVLNYAGFAADQLVGKTLTATFLFGLNRTKPREFELNEPLSGLQTGDYFEAELFSRENDFRDTVLIKLYHQLK